MTIIKKEKHFFRLCDKKWVGICPQKCHFPLGMWAPFIARFLGPCESASVFARPRDVTNRQTNTTQKLTTQHCL